MYSLPPRDLHIQNLLTTIFTQANSSLKGGFEARLINHLYLYNTFGYYQKYLLKSLRLSPRQFKVSFHISNIRQSRVLSNSLLFSFMAPSGCMFAGGIYHGSSTSLGLFTGDSLLKQSGVGRENHACVTPFYKFGLKGLKLFRQVYK